MFLDEAKINIKAGDGGNGMISFFYLRGSRKKIASGGSGGKGGNVIIRASSNVNTLYGFKKRCISKHKMGRMACQIPKMVKMVKKLLLKFR